MSMKDKKPGKKPGFKPVKSSASPEAEIKDLKNRVLLECPRPKEAVDTWVRRRFPDGANNIPFASLPLSRRTINGLSESEYKNMTKVQLMTIPCALAGRDMLAESRTGSGKTVGFLVPVLERLHAERWSAEDGLGAVILSPTRELASQVFQVLQNVGKRHDFSAGLIVGGRDVRTEARSIGNLNIVIATPGRLLQHLEETAGFSLENVKLFVIDEADRILDLGFRQTMVDIVNYLPGEGVQRLLFSATLRSTVKELATVALQNPEVVSVSKDEVVPSQLKQYVMEVELEHKVDRLYSFLRSHLKSKCIVFVSACKQVRFVAEVLRRLKVGMTVFDLLGKQSIEKRIFTYENFKARSDACVLVCTDVAARGLDIVDVSWVVQFDLPESASEYVHRVGRTARLDRPGSSLLFSSAAEWTIFKTELETHKIPMPQVVNPKQAKLLPSLTPRVASMLALDKEFNDMAAKCFKVSVRALALSGRVPGATIQAKFKIFAESLGLGFLPEVTLPAGRAAAADAETKTMKDGRKSKLEKLKQKIQDKRAAKAAAAAAGKRQDADSDGWSEEMREDEEQRPKEKKTKEKKPKAAPLPVKADEEEEEMLVLRTKAATETAATPMELETQAEAQAKEALKRKRVRIKKDGTAYVRGAGALGRPASHQVFHSDNEEEQGERSEEEDELEREAFIERTKRRLEERKQEMDDRERLRVKEKHAKVKAKLRGDKLNKEASSDEGEQEDVQLDTHTLASPVAEEEEEEVDVAELEKAFKKSYNRL